MSISTTAHASTRDIRTHDGLNVAWAAVAAIIASRVPINTALTLIWHLKKIESKSNPDLSYEDQLPSSGDTFRQATLYRPSAQRG